MTSHHPHQVGSAEPNDDNPSSAVDGFFKPAIDGWQFASFLFGPTNCSFSVPAAQEEQDHAGNEHAREADQGIGKGVDKWHRAKQVAVAAGQSQHDGGSLINPGRTDVATDRPKGEQGSRGNQDESSGRGRDFDRGRIRRRRKFGGNVGHSLTIYGNPVHGVGRPQGTTKGVT